MALLAPRASLLQAKSPREQRRVRRAKLRRESQRLRRAGPFGELGQLSLTKLWGRDQLGRAVLVAALSPLMTECCLPAESAGTGQADSSRPGRTLAHEQYILMHMKFDAGDYRRRRNMRPKLHRTPRATPLPPAATGLATNVSATPTVASTAFLNAALRPSIEL